MEEIQLEVQLREEIGTRQVRRVRRREDMIPGVVYGGNRKPTLIKVDRRTYERILRQHAGESIVFHINVMQGQTNAHDYSAIVREEQHDPVAENVVHIDFLRISLKEKIEVKVPVISKKEAVGVTKGGGSLDHVIWELDIVCLPMQIPQHIAVDVSAMQVGDAVYVKDIVLPEGVVTHHDPEAIVFSVVPPMKEEEEKKPEGEEGVEPELIKEEKEEAKEESAQQPEKEKKDEGSAKS